MTYRGITIKQPWAECIAAGFKTIENRASFFTYRGPLLIHAGLRTDGAALNDPRVTATLARIPGNRTFAAGAVIAVADLVDVHEAVEIPTLTGDPGVCCEPWGERVYSARVAKHLVLANVYRLGKPVQCRGALGLWVPSLRVVEQVEQQLTVAEATR
jgi:hypothetical protein